MADTKGLALEENQGDIVIYQTEDGDTKIDVRFVVDPTADGRAFSVLPHQHRGAHSTYLRGG